jgi:murein DD-endopeptidase MepM/ murein hydrolase activator NlpD
MKPIKDPNIITQGYNNFDLRYLLTPGWWGLHKGIDFGTYRKNVNCQAIFDGKITFSGLDGGWGIKIQLYNEKLKIYATYAHLDHILAREGQFCASGDDIGVVGNTGNSTGIHLHLGASTKPRSGWIDPTPYLIELTPTQMAIQQVVKAQQNALKAVQDGNIAGAVDNKTGKAYLIKDSKKRELPVEQVLASLYLPYVSTETLNDIPNK